MWRTSLIVGGILLGVIAPSPIAQVSPSEAESASFEPAGEEKPRRLSITLQVNSPEEILIKEGDQLVKGQIVATNDRERERLKSQVAQLRLSVLELSQPLPKPGPPPAPSYAAEEAAIFSAKTNLKFLEAQTEPEFTFKDEGLVQVFEASTLKERQRIASRRMNGHFRLNEAIANLQEAKSSYQRELYQHQLKLIEIDQENRRRSAEAVSQQEKLGVIEKELNELDFKSPYGGKVRKVKILGQNGRLLNVEILVINPDRNG